MPGQHGIPCWTAVSGGYGDPQGIADDVLQAIGGAEIDQGQGEYDRGLGAEASGFHLLRKISEKMRLTRTVMANQENSGPGFQLQQPSEHLKVVFHLRGEEKALAKPVSTLTIQVLQAHHGWVAAHSHVFPDTCVPNCHRPSLSISIRTADSFDGEVFGVHPNPFK